MTDLEKARQIINDVDSKMRDLFIERMKAAKTVAEYKKLHGIKVLDPQREAEVLARNSDAFTDNELKGYYVDFLMNNMEISKRYQHQLIDGQGIANSDK